MGTFAVRLKIAHQDGGDSREVEALVDTGATHSTLPGALLDELHIQRRENQRFLRASGEPIYLDMGQAWISYEDRSWICPVIFADDESTYLMGATTLEAFGLLVDPKGKTLIRAEHIARPF